MTSLEIARLMAQLGQENDATDAYIVALNDELTPAERLEAAAYIFDHGGDYKISYSVFVQLYNAGQFREQILPLMTKAFYEPNLRLLKNRYERNVKRLSKYPYFFRTDFPAFEALPIRFFPFDDHNGYIPYEVAKDVFLDFVNVKEPIVSRNFFADLEKPILADDVFSQYELEYLIDNVRPSEWIGRENHIYLHYNNWPEFCAWLSVLTVKRLTDSKKVVFLIEDEIIQYPIDFNARFGIDYSQYSVQPIHISEVNKLIWHTQFSSSNGGDFFNEVFDAHPNLLARPSIMFDSIEEAVEKIRERIKTAGSLANALEAFADWEDDALIRDLYAIHDPTDKDLLVAMYLRSADWTRFADPSARIAPALFFQPHFHNMFFSLTTNRYNYTTIECAQLDAIRRAPMVRAFKYIKTFTPLRRFTTSYGSTLRYMEGRAKEEYSIIGDVISQRILNRSYMRNRDERVFKDSVVVRFEDGKLYPEATFRPLAAFLDIPYTESMTYCSAMGVRDVQTEVGNAIGFDSVTVYKTYDEYINDSERYYIECFLRDAYEYYGYGFEKFDGQVPDEKKVQELIADFTVLNEKIRSSYLNFANHELGSVEKGSPEDYARKLESEAIKRQMDEKRLEIAKGLLRALRFINKRGQPLEMIPMLQPDPDLLDQPLYH